MGVRYTIGLANGDKTGAVQAFSNARHDPDFDSIVLERLGFHISNEEDSLVEYEVPEDLAAVKKLHYEIMDTPTPTLSRYFHMGVDYNVGVTLEEMITYQRLGLTVTLYAV